MSPEMMPPTDDPAGLKTWKVPPVALSPVHPTYLPSGGLPSASAVRLGLGTEWNGGLKVMKLPPAAIS